MSAARASSTIAAAIMQSRIARRMRIFRLSVKGFQGFIDNLAVYRFAEDGVDPEELRERLKTFDDAGLKMWGEAAASLANQPNSRDVWAIQLEIARAEWRRRYPKLASGQ